jgi:hypothetical protein
MSPNDQLKLKVLQGLKNHMDTSAGRRLAQRVKPKAMQPEPTLGVPGGPGAMAGVPTPGMPEGGLGDDDKNRLLDLYAKVK